MDQSNKEDKVRKPLIYLAGAIRDGIIGDYGWREHVITELESVADFINPLGNKTYNASTKQWLMSGQVTTSKSIVAHDFWAIDHVDAVIFNFKALSEGYPNIGTLVEFGRATARPVLIYSIIAANYTGHQNVAMFKLHPFLAESSAMVFNTVDDCVAYLREHLKVMSGENPHFGGVV